MTLTTTEYKHIQMNENNVPIIAGTTMKVVELITSVKAYQWTPEELHKNYPHVSMSKIHGALSYYWDHKQEIDAEIERIEEWVDKMGQETRETPIFYNQKSSIINQELAKNPEELIYSLQGKYAHATTSSEEFAQQKQAEIDWEKRNQN